MNIIETQNLTKTYGDFTAVSHLNLHIRKGSVLWIFRSERSGKIHNDENVSRFDAADRRKFSY